MAFDYDLVTGTLGFGPHRFTLTWARSVTPTPEEKGPVPYGCGLWPSALVLGHALGTHQARLRGARVLELGCGVGLGAVVAASFGAHATATDEHPDMGTFVARNAAANHVEVAWQVMDWARTVVMPQWDVVVGSDLLYDPASVGPCVDVLQGALAPGGLALLADPGRRGLWRLVDKLRERGFSVDHQRVDLASLPVEGSALVLDAHPVATGPAHLLAVSRT